MIHRPPSFNGFEFVKVASLRATQLMRGCSPRVTAGFRAALTAQREVVAGKVWAEAREAAGHPMPYERSEIEPVRPRVAQDLRPRAQNKPNL